MAETIRIADSMMRELALIETMQAANLSSQLDQDVRDLCRLIQEKAEYQDFPTLRIELLQSLNRLAQAASLSRVKAADEMVDLFLAEVEKCPLLPVNPLMRITHAEAWTDWITMVLKNCGAWKLARQPVNANNRRPAG